MKPINTVLLILFSSVFLIQCAQKDRRPAAASESKNQSYAFEVCYSDKKNYLEKQILQSVPEEYLKPHDADWEKTIPMKCIQFAQKNFQGSFAYCESQDDKPNPNAQRPCLSQNYVQLVYNAYHDVKNCFNLDPKRSFLQIMIESGFHINAINRTGFDAGISQFTKNGILRVMDKDILSKTKNQLLLSSSPSCSRIANVFDDLEKDAFSLQKRCSMMAVPQNPYRALVLHYLHTLRDQIFFKNEFIKSRPEIALLVDQDILEQFVYLAYNRGINGTLKLIDGYVADRKKMNRPIQKADLDLFKNLSEARKIMRAEPEKKEILKKAKIKNLTLAEYAIIHDKTYLATMAEARDFVRAKLGEDCF